MPAGPRQLLGTPNFCGPHFAAPWCARSTPTSRPCTDAAWGGIYSLPEAEIALLARIAQCELFPNPRQPRSPPHPDASPLSPQHDGVFPGRTQREPVGDPHRPRAPAAPSH